MGKFTDYQSATHLAGTETMLLAQNGKIVTATLDMLRDASPNSAGVYPDVPLNRVTIKRNVPQASTIVVLDDNLSMVEKIRSLCYPCLVDRNSQVAAYLNGDDTTKTVDGLAAPLGDYTLQEMVHIGGFYHKYVYDAAHNIKETRLSVYPVKGYKYVRGRFFPMKAGTVEEQGGKKLLLSNSNKWSTQNYDVQQYHEFAKNLGEHFRDIAIQDYNIYRTLFFLFKGTYNSQSLYDLTGFGWNSWAATSNSEDSSTTQCAQPYKLGITNSIKGHEGQLDAQTFTYKDGSTVNFRPYKFLWAEGFLAGPYWIRCTGALKKAHKWYVAKDINTCTTFDPTDDSHTYLCDACQDDGFITETFEDTMFVTKVGGSDSTYFCDYYWLNKTDVTSVFIPVAVGSADGGSNVGSSCLRSSDGVSGSSPSNGGAVASDEPTETVADGTVVV